MVPHERAVIVAATGVERRALEHAAPHARIVECGIAFSRCDPTALGTTVISCGLAGGLRTGLPTGSVLVADRVRRPNGEVLVCDRALVLQLTAAARKLHLDPVVAPLLTAAEIVTRSERVAWANDGYAAVDMESGLIVAPRVGVVRVILDTPQREISPAWRHPSRAFLNPLLWGQALWLAREGTRCAAVAASVVAGAIG